MKYKDFGIVAISDEEALSIVGGVDKGAQDALYVIGYVIGVVAKVFVSLYRLIVK